jgi:uncharacterized protein YunC (DUF1805 family)
MNKATRQRKAPEELKYINNFTVCLSKNELEALTKKASSLGISKAQVVRKGLQYILNNNQ